jgi:peptide/nickel transport system substrate-binding protein
MTASDMPTTTGAPDNGFEGMRFLGYPVYEGLVSWDLSRADNKPMVCIAGRQRSAKGL